MDEFEELYTNLLRTQNELIHRIAVSLEHMVQLSTNPEYAQSEVSAKTFVPETPTPPQGVTVIQPGDDGDTIPPTEEQTAIMELAQSMGEMALFHEGSLQVEQRVLDAYARRVGASDQTRG